MSANTARKNESVKHQHMATRAEIFDFNDISKMQVAIEAEQACHLPGNTEPCDYEEFMEKYGIKPTAYFE